MKHKSSPTVGLTAPDADHNNSPSCDFNPYLNQISGAMPESPASLEKKKQNQGHNENHNSSWPQKPAAFTAVSSHHHATR